MAIDFTAKYPGRFDPVSALYPQGKFKNRSAPNTEDGSYMERDWLNDWNGFFGALLKNANVTPNGTVDTATASQLYDALRLVTGGKYGTALIGSLVHWPLQQMPQEIFTDLGQVYIPYIAQAFDKNTFPLLGKLHPSGVLPADMRGEFPRGWDGLRGTDPNRVLMSAQESTLFSQYIGKFAPNGDGHMIQNSDGIRSTIPSFSRFKADGGQYGDGVGIVGIKPRNIAWNMIVRAA
ncbi:MAG: hypothetical protein ACRC8W_14570 [Plesiomonas shigelloides]